MSIVIGEDIVERSIFSETQFDEMIDWLDERKNYEIYCNLTGRWFTNEFFKGKGKVLKKYNGNIFYNSLYILLEEGDLGKEDILIGRKIIQIKKPSILPARKLGKHLRKLIARDPEAPELLLPNTFELENHFKKDMQHQVFFRAEQDYEEALEWLHSFTQKYQVSCHIEGILVGIEQQIQCIITGTIEKVSDKDIFVRVMDAFDPTDPLNDDTKEYLSRNWLIQISRSGIDKVHPEYMVFELGEELALTKQALTVENVKVVLGGRTIIHDVNFQIKKGEILGIIGESGAGKTTTLKAILGEFEYEGEIKVFGIDARKTRAIAPFIGYVPQDLSRMYGNFNALENIVAFGRQYGIPDDILIQRGKQILKDLGIDDVANQRVDSLSGGQKRRVSIAISIVHNPYLIFLDEPTSGLDPLTRYELWQYLDIINKNYGITLCVISHYLDEIEYCDKACIFLRGIGFYDFDTPLGLKQKLPGKGLALEVTLENVTIEAVEMLKSIPNIEFVIQRGERIRLLSDIPSNELALKVIETLEKNNIEIHSIENKVEIDMIDYFTYVSSIHQTQRRGAEESGIEIDMDLEKVRQLKIKNEDVDIDFVMNAQLKKITKKSTKKSAKKTIKKSTKKSAKKTIKKSTKKSAKKTIKKSTKKSAKKTIKKSS
ncbi:MAG: ABC transporter ATP-binding protein [Promethearchaeota archaeon]